MSNDIGYGEYGYGFIPYGGIGAIKSSGGVSGQQKVTVTSGNAASVENGGTNDAELKY